MISDFRQVCSNFFPSNPNPRPPIVCRQTRESSKKLLVILIRKKVLLKMSFLCRIDILLRGPSVVPVAQLRQDFAEVLLAVCGCVTDINHAFEPGRWCITRVSPLPQDGAWWPGFRAAPMGRVRLQTCAYGLCMLCSVLTHRDVSYEILMNKCSFCLCPTGLPIPFSVNATVLSEIDYCAPGKGDWVRTLTIHCIALLSSCMAGNSNISDISCHDDCFIAIT